MSEPTQQFPAAGTPCPAKANTGESLVSGESVLTCDKLLGYYGDHSGPHNDPVRGEWGKEIADSRFDPLAGMTPTNPEDLP